MTRIVITGATGFIGSNLASLYLRQGYEVFALVRPESQSRSILPVHENLRIIEGDLDHVLDCVASIRQAEGFLHLAWGGVNRDEID